MSLSAPKNAAAPAPEEDIQAAWDLPLAEIGRGPAAAGYAAQQPSAAAARQAPVSIKTPGAVPGAPLQDPYLMPEAGPQHLYTGLLDIAPIQAVAYAPPPEPPQRNLGYCALCAVIAALGAFMGLILFFLVLRLTLSAIKEHETTNMAATNSVESVMPHARRSGTGSRPRRRREDLRGPSAETSEAPTTASWERQDVEGTTASSDRAAGVRSKETVRQHPNDGRTSMAAAV